MPQVEEPLKELEAKMRKITLPHKLSSGSITENGFVFLHKNSLLKINPSGAVVKEKSFKSPFLYQTSNNLLFLQDNKQQQLFQVDPDLNLKPVLQVGGCIQITYTSSHHLFVANAFVNDRLSFSLFFPDFSLYKQFPFMPLLDFSEFDYKNDREFCAHGFFVPNLQKDFIAFSKFKNGSVFIGNLPSTYFSFCNSFKSMEVELFLNTPNAPQSLRFARIPDEFQQVSKLNDGFLVLTKNYHLLRLDFNLKIVFRYDLSQDAKPSYFRNDHMTASLFSQNSVLVVDLE